MVVCITFLVCSTINPLLVEHLTVYDDSFGVSLRRHTYTISFFLFLTLLSCCLYRNISDNTNTIVAIRIVANWRS